MRLQLVALTYKPSVIWENPVDVLSPLAELAGVPVNFPFDSVNFASALSGQNAPREADGMIFNEYHGSRLR